MPRLLTGLFRYDDASHTYRFGRVVVPSITQVIAHERLVSPFYTDEGRERGQRVHAWTASFDLGASASALDSHDSDAGYNRAYLAFVDAKRPEYEQIEKPLGSRLFRFAGRPDRVGRWRDGRPFVIDLKCGGPLPEHGIQTAAQVILAEGDDVPRQFRGYARARYTLHLHNDGRFKLVAWTSLDDYDEWWYRLARYHASHKET